MGQTETDNVSTAKKDIDTQNKPALIHDVLHELDSGRPAAQNKEYLEEVNKQLATHTDTKDIFNGFQIVGVDDKHHLLAKDKQGAQHAYDDQGNEVGKVEKTEAKDQKAEANTEKGSPSEQHLEEERKKLTEKAERLIEKPEDLKRFKEDMQALEKRTAQMEDRFHRQGKDPAEAHRMAQEEVAKTYHEVGRILDAAETGYRKPLMKKEWENLSEEVLHNSAHPTDIDQGDHKTCTVRSVESRINDRTPSVMANMVADLALDGQHKGADGTVVKFDLDADSKVNNIIPHDEALTHPPKDGDRGHASQIAEVGLVNMYYAKSKPNIHYEQHDPDYGSTPPDTGERLMDYSKTPPQEIGRSPELTDTQLTEAANSLTGEKSGKWLLHESGTDACTVVKNKAELEKALREGMERGEDPLVIGIHTGFPPFDHDSGANTAVGNPDGKPHGKGGWHAVTGVGYQPADPAHHKPARVGIDNSWGKAHDHLDEDSLVSIEQLFNSMKGPPM